MLPVPLNSWKISSSIRLPVSIRAVARTVSEPPSSNVRAAPKRRLGTSMRLDVHPARHGPARVRPLVVGAGQAGQAVEQDQDLAARLGDPLGAVDGQLGQADVLLGGVVRRRGDDLAADAPAHLGDLLGPLVDQEDEQVQLGVVRARRPRRSAGAGSSCPSAAGATISPRWPLPTGVSRSMTRIPIGSAPVSRRIRSCGSIGGQVVEAAEAQVFLGRRAPRSRSARRAGAPPPCGGPRRGRSGGRPGGAGTWPAAAGRRRRRSCPP